VCVVPRGAEAGEVLADGKDSGAKMGVQRHLRQAADREGGLTERAVTYPVRGVGTRQIQDGGEIDVESEALQGRGSGRRLEPHRRLGSGPPRQVERGLGRSENRLEPADPSPLLIEGDEGRDPGGTEQGVGQAADLSGGLDVAGEEDQPTGTDPLQKRPQGRVHGRPLESDPQELSDFFLQREVSRGRHRRVL